MKLRLREWREKRLLSQEDLAAKSGVAVVTISRLEREVEVGRPSTLRKLAEALGVSSEELLAES